VVIAVPLRSAPFAVVKQVGDHMTPASACCEPCLALYVLLFVHVLGELVDRLQAKSA
jgi:hypothetical protein